MTKTIKKHLTKSEEFDVLKIVLDKFLLLGVLIAVLGVFIMATGIQSVAFGFAILGSGMIIMLLFALLLVKEYQFLSH